MSKTTKTTKKAFEKTSKPSSSASFLALDKKLSSIKGFELGSVLSDNDFSTVDEFISLGNYTMNAQFSGSLFGGIPNNRSVGLAGDPGTGKTFVCLNALREAQRLGYSVIYCDTESAVDESNVRKFGGNPDLVRYQPISTVSEFQKFAYDTIDAVTTIRKDDPDFKVFIILDSLGMLSTDKELADAARGHNAMDMGLKAKEVRKLFRVITMKLAAAKIPLIVTNHTYTNASQYVPVKEWASGDAAIFACSIVSFLSKINVKDKETKEQTGILATSKLRKSRFTRPRDTKLHISFFYGMNPYVGLEDYVSWDACGIQKGKIETKKEFEKMKTKPSDYREFVFDQVDVATGEITPRDMVFIPSDTGKWCVKHLGKSLMRGSDMFSPHVFTMDILKKLDETVIQPAFKLPDISDPAELDFILDDDNDTGED